MSVKPSVPSLVERSRLVGPQLDPDTVGTTSARIDWWSWGFVGLGIVLRLVAYFLNFPLWWDEAFVAVNLLKRDFLGLVKPLDYGQVCPLFFLWAELISVRLLGFHEWSLRLFPLICSMGALVLFRVVAGRILDGKALLLAVAVFAVSLHPIRHAADVKPYSTDLLMALIVQGIALEWSRRPEKAFWLYVLAGFGPIALFFSHPAVFVIGGVGMALTRAAWQTRSWSVRIAWFAYGAVSLLAYALIYVCFTLPQASAAASGMKQMWIQSFPPLHSLADFLRWLAVAHSGDMLAYPCGGERGGSTLSLVACLLGIMAIGRQRHWNRLGILLAPLGLAIVVAAFRFYPYGGPAPHGSAARIMQYAAPSLCLLIGLGASRILDWIPSASFQNRSLRIGCLGLVVVGIVPQVSGYLHPYRAYQAEASRRFARQFWAEVGQDAEVACLRWDFHVADWNSIHLGIAVSLCNEAIYSPSRMSQGPDLAKVTPSHPLRCVLGVAPEQDSPRVVEWLGLMNQTYDLRTRKTIPVGMSEPGRPAEFELYEVFEFIPKGGIDSSQVGEFQSVRGL